MRAVLHRFGEDRASEIVDRVVASSEPTIQVIDGPRTGRSHILQLVAEGLANRGMSPILVSPPVREIDTAALALMQAAVGLASVGAIPQDAIPWRVAGNWSERLGDVRRWFGEATHDDRLVLLLDDVRQWPIPEASDSRSHVDDATDLFLREIFCRKVIIGDHDLPGETIRLGAPAGSDLLGAEADWGVLADVVTDLRQRLPDLATRGFAHVALVVAAASLTTPTQVETWWSADTPSEFVADRVVDVMGELPSLRPLWNAVVTCAVPRRPVSREWFASEFERIKSLVHQEVLERCLLAGDSSVELSRDVRAAIWRMDTDDFVERSRRDAASRLRTRYAGQVQEAVANGRPEALLSGAELLYIGSRIGDLDVAVHAHPAFADQLSAFGVIALERGRWADAVEAFDRALDVDSEDAFARHYLGFALDNDALEPKRVEQSYSRAIESDWTHATWHARLLSFLVVQARMGDVERRWAVSRSTLMRPDGDSSAALYSRLHMPVAANLLRRAELAMADEILSDVPAWAHSQLPDFDDQWRRLQILDRAQDVASFVPARRALSEWWTEPELLSQRLPDGRPLQRWIAAGVEAVHERGFDLSAAIVEGPGGFSTGSLTLDYERLERFSVDTARTDQLDVGDFVEIGFYGLGSEVANDPVVRVLEREKWTAGVETPLDPARYLQRAAW